MVDFEFVITEPINSVFIKPEMVEKHLLGQHDQSTHGHHDNGAGPTHVFSEYGDKVPLVHVSAPNGGATHHDYEMQHQAAANNGFSANILNLDEHMPDVFDKAQGPRLYGTNSPSDKESFKALYSLTGDPNQKVTIYRGVPTTATSINNGDWVTLSSTYAAQHVASNLGGQGHVLATEVPASALWSDGDSINEFGLDFSTEVHKNALGWILPTTVPDFVEAIGGIDKVNDFYFLPIAQLMPTQLKIDLGKHYFTKHLLGQHDQSTHAPQHRAGVPAGLDLEGKRYSEEAVTEFRSKAHAYQDARITAKEKAMTAMQAGKTTEEKRQIYQDAYNSDPDLIKAKAELDSNFLYKDAMNVRDANGIRLGDKTELLGTSDETPSDYLMRMGVGGERLPNPSIFQSGPNYYDPRMQGKVGSVRVTPEEAVAIATTDFKLWAAKADSVIVMPQDKLNQVLASGRVKTVHETGTSTVGQSTQDYIDHRLIYENVAYGYDNSMPLDARPVSGILMQDGYHPTDALSAYGGKKASEIILKPETRERTTWTDNDSLNTFRAGRTVSSTVFSPTVIANKAGAWRKATGKNYFETKNFRSSLTEIQVHGGIKTSDIAKVRFFSPPSASVVARLSKLDIPYEVVEAGVTTN